MKSYCVQNLAVSYANFHLPTQQIYAPASRNEIGSRGKKIGVGGLSVLTLNLLKTKFVYCKGVNPPLVFWKRGSNKTTREVQAWDYSEAKFSKFKTKSAGI